MESVAFQLAITSFVHFRTIDFVQRAVPVNVLVQEDSGFIVQPPFLVFGAALVFARFFQHPIWMPLLMFSHRLSKIKLPLKLPFS